MYRKMLVLLDGSKLAEVVFSYAQELSARLNINLELLHVCSPREEELLPMRQAYMEHMAEALHNRVMKIRSKMGDKISSPKTETRGTVVVGYPAEEILKYADKNNIDLIMLSTHGQSGIRAWDIGNVANKVIHASKLPVWLVPTELRQEIIYDKLPKRTMVIPLDGSEFSETVIPHAINIAKQRGAELEMVLIHVNEIPTTVNLVQVERQQAEITAKKRYLSGIAKRVGEAGIKARAKLLRGDPAEAIVNYIENHPTQLVTLASHGHAGLSKMIFGSVTENILHLVKKTPIFVVRPGGLR